MHPPFCTCQPLSTQAWSWWTDPQQLSSSSRVRETGDSPVCPGEASGCRKENHACGQGPAEAGHCTRAGSTFVACFRSGETWKFGGLMGGKDPLLQKEKGKKQPPCFPGAPSRSQETRHSPPPRCLLLFSRTLPANGYRPQHSTSNLFDRPAAKTGEDPRSPSPPCRHLTFMTPAALLAAPGCAGAQTAQAWGQLTSCKFHHNSHCLRHRAQRQACKSTAL